jgi:hypothetical protein
MSLSNARYRYIDHPYSNQLPACRLHPGSSQDLAAIRSCILEPARIWLNSHKLDPTPKFTEIHNSHASYDKIQHHHLTRRKCISQGGMQQYHKNSWTRRNAKISYSPYIIWAHTVSSAWNFPLAAITCSMWNVAILSWTFANNDMLRGCSSSPNLWI